MLSTEKQRLLTFTEVVDLPFPELSIIDFVISGQKLS